MCVCVCVCVWPLSVLEPFCVEPFVVVFVVVASLLFPVWPLSVLCGCFWWPLCVFYVLPGCFLCGPFLFSVHPTSIQLNPLSSSSSSSSSLALRFSSSLLRRVCGPFLCDPFLCGSFRCGFRRRCFLVVSCVAPFCFLCASYVFLVAPVCFL